MRKEEILEHWRNLDPNQPLNPQMVPYKHEGSTYEEDGIRITGSREFIDAVLSRLKDLLEYEDDTTRLQLVYKQSQDRQTKRWLDSYNCYIQVHERGREAQMVNAIIASVRGKTGKEMNHEGTNRDHEL